MSIIKRIPKFVIIIIVTAVPVLLLIAAFIWVGYYYRDDERIYPNISISDVDVSWMTREEAIEALNLSQYEQRVEKTSVKVTFPDDSVLTLTGKDINLTTDAEGLVKDVFNIGRGRGFIPDTISFIRRLGSSMLYFNILDIYDLEILHSQVAGFVAEYNKNLVETETYIDNQKVVITKGAGHELVDVQVLQDIVYMGLFDSYETGYPVEVTLTLPEVQADISELFHLRELLNVPVESAALDRETLLVSDAVVGVDFDYFNAWRQLSETESGKTVTIFIDYIQPEITREYLESLLFRDLLGECTTWVHGTADRVTNVRLASEAISGLVLKPGDEFSFNDIVGKRDASRGYRPGGAFVGGETVTVIGGGVCQVSSTLYASIVDTEILFTERHQHSRSVPYLPRGRDATVFWNKLDFKFVNNTEYPIRIEFDLEDRYLTAWVVGTIIDDFPTPPLPPPPMPAG